MNYQRIEAIEAFSAYKLQEEVNRFIANLERAPIDIQYQVFNYRYASGEVAPHYVAFVRYVNAPIDK